MAGEARKSGAQVGSDARAVSIQPIPSGAGAGVRSLRAEILGGGGGGGRGLRGCKPGVAGGLSLDRCAWEVQKLRGEGAAGG